MSAAPSAARLIIRRELRGEKGLFVFAAGVMAAATAALTLVLSLSDIFEKSRQQQSRVLLGGDMALRLSQREFSAAEREWLVANSAEQSELRIARILATGGGRAQLARLKGVAENYPLFGELALRDADAAPPLAATVGADGVLPAYASESLLVLLGIQLGDTFSAGGLTLRAAAIIDAEPDPDLRFWMSGAPAIMVAKAAMETPDFMRPGALVERFFRVTLPPDLPAAAWREALEAEFPEAGWRVLAPENAQNSTRRVVGRMRDFLAIAALAAMLAAGIGCGNSISAFLRARARSIAVLKMLGGGGGLVRRVYLFLAALFAAGGALAGAVLGNALLFAAAPLLSAALPWEVSARWLPEVMGRAFFVAVALTAAFAAPPVLRFARLNPLLLFAGGNNDAAAPPPKWEERIPAAVALVLAAVVLPLDWDKKLMLAGVAAFAALLYGGAILFAAVLARVRFRNTIVRLGTLAIVRNKRRAASAVMSFGVGVFVLVAALNVEVNFSGRIDDTLRKKAPALFITGALPSQRETLDATVARLGGETRLVPFLRGRITSLGGRTAADLLETATESRWVLRGDRVLTWSESGEDIGASYVSAGTLWNDKVAGLQASFAAEEAGHFDVQLGDEVGLNVLGEQVTAVVTSFRNVEWQNFDINFVVILNGPPFADVPHTFMGAVDLPEGEAGGAAGDGAAAADATGGAATNTPPEIAAKAQLALVTALPNVLPIATAPLFDAAKVLLARVAALLRATALFLLAAGLPMVVATLIENRRQRQQNAVALRLLGATRRTIAGAGFAEFFVLAALAVVPAVLCGALAGRVLVAEIFDLPWQAHWGQSLAIGAAAAVAFLLLAAADIFAAASKAPYPLLRNE